jgi:hypothetical protein
VRGLVLAVKLSRANRRSQPVPKAADKNPPAAEIFSNKKPGEQSDEHIARRDQEPKEVEERDAKPQAREGAGLAETDPRQAKPTKPS